MKRNRVKKCFALILAFAIIISIAIPAISNDMATNSYKSNNVQTTKYLSFDGHGPTPLEGLGNERDQASVNTGSDGAKLEHKHAEVLDITPSCLWATIPV